MILDKLRMCLGDMPAPAWQSRKLEECIRYFCEMNGADFRNACQLLRAAVTGSMQSPPIFSVLEILGREESLSRIDDALPDEVKARMSSRGNWATPGWRADRIEAE